MGKVVNLVSAAAVAASFFAFSGSAHAATVTLGKQGPDVFGPNDPQVVNTSVTGNVYAGGFHLTDGINNFVAWCLDLANYLDLPTVYETTNTPFTNTTGALTPSKVADLESLFETAYDGLDMSISAQNAGFQIALWEIVNETGSTYDVTSGSFFMESPTTTEAENFANSILGGIGGPITQSYQLTFYESSKDAHGNQISQNLVSVAPIPLPASVWMLGLALFGLFGLRRRAG